MDVNGDAVLQREPPVPGDVVGMGVGLDDAHEPGTLPLRLLDDRLGRVRRIDHDREAGVLIADEVTGAPQIVVQELLEEHRPTLAPVAAMNPKARLPLSACRDARYYDDP
jgi:hypothetical protein